MSSSRELDDARLERIKQSLDGLEFGQVQIIIHDGRIVQIERTERSRFGNEPPARNSAPNPHNNKTGSPKSSKDGQ